MNKIEQAFEHVPRANFVPAQYKHYADYDEALPIGYDQTISQPTTVSRMPQWLDVGAGQTVLDVGSGSGWTSALLAYLTGAHGSVTAVEIVPELVAMGEANCARLKINNVSFHQAGTVFGWPQAAPYDRILVSAAAAELPTELLDQLANGGKMVIPVGDDIIEATKNAAGTVSQIVHYGYIFVPLVRSVR